MATNEQPLIEQEISFRVSVNQLDLVHASWKEFQARIAPLAHPPLEGNWVLEFETALAEIAANIVEYAYPEPLEAEAEVFRLRLRLYPDRVEASFFDQGIPATLPGETPFPPNRGWENLAEGGYGLAVVRAAIDELEYYRTSDGTNRWLLRKYRPESVHPR